jgi:hypothetical protein
MTPNAELGEEQLAEGRAVCSNEEALAVLDLVLFEVDRPCRWLAACAAETALTLISDLRG